MTMTKYKADDLKEKHLANHSLPLTSNIFSVRPVRIVVDGKSKAEHIRKLPQHINQETLISDNKWAVN